MIDSSQVHEKETKVSAKKDEKKEPEIVKNEETEKVDKKKDSLVITKEESDKSNDTVKVDKVDVDKNQELIETPAEKNETSVPTSNVKETEASEELTSETLVEPAKENKEKQEEKTIDEPENVNKTIPENQEPTKETVEGEVIIESKIPEQELPETEESGSEQPSEKEIKKEDDTGDKHPDDSLTEQTELEDKRPENATETGEESVDTPTDKTPEPPPLETYSQFAERVNAEKKHDGNFYF